VRILDTAIADIKEIRPERHGDARGYFSEIYREDSLREIGIAVNFVQENQSYSAAKGVLRGLHFQAPPAAQAKLVRVSAGAILDVAVDMRWGSPDFARHVAIVLSAAEGNQLWVPEGFAHGFYTLEAHTEVIYKVNRYYAPAQDRGVLWNDPALAISWPLNGPPILSEKDQRLPLFSKLPHYFEYGR
jgi:dTDP-4-dehydrorhamnose 3,5-epimerase